MFISILQRHGWFEPLHRKVEFMLVVLIVAAIGLSLMAELVLTRDDVDGFES